MNWRIPLADLDLGTEEMAAVQEVLQSRWLTMGEKTQIFERDFAQFSGAKHAIAVSNCTVGLHMACAAAGLGPGDEVIVPSLSFVATSNAVRYTGATPVFADVTSLDELTLSPQAVAACITPRTRAIIIMHYGGYACRMEEFFRLAEEHHLTLIEDAAHAVGADWQGRSLGTLGHIGCYSFFSNKNMTTGEGGMVVTQDDALAERLRLLRSHGMTSLTWDRHRGHAWSYDVVELGFNYRIDELRAAIGVVQLGKLPANNQKRRKRTREYHQRLQARLPQVGLPFLGREEHSSCHLLPVILPEGTQRVRVMEAMKAAGIQTSIHYPPSHMFAYYRRIHPESVALPVTEAAAERELTLPLYPGMTPEDVNLVVDTLAEALRA